MVMVAVVAVVVAVLPSPPAPPVVVASAVVRPLLPVPAVVVGIKVDPVVAVVVGSENMDQNGCLWI